MHTRHKLACAVILAAGGCASGPPADPAAHETHPANPRAAATPYAPPDDVLHPAPPPDAPIEYACRMHPQVVRPQPGACPICSMPLVPREAKEPAHDHH